MNPEKIFIISECLGLIKTFKNYEIYRFRYRGAFFGYLIKEVYVVVAFDQIVTKPGKFFCRKKDYKLLVSFLKIEENTLFARLLESYKLSDLSLF
jgi:hypothetical protein